jgi:hypothetical protein
MFVIGMTNVVPSTCSSVRWIIEMHSPAVNGFSSVWDSPALPTATTTSLASSRICSTNWRCPRWNGWNRPGKKPRILLGGAQAWKMSGSGRRVWCRPVEWSV